MCETIKTDLMLFAAAFLASGIVLGANVTLAEIVVFMARVL